MRSRGLVAGAAALVASLLLGGCAEVVSVPEATPVAGKLCALSDAAGFDDQGLNRETYISLQKAKVAHGVPLSLYSLKAEDNHEDARAQLTRLVKGNCSLIIASGDFLSEDTYQVALENPQQQFALIDHHFERTSGGAGSHTMMPGNIHYVANQMLEAAFAAGYLAAMSSQNNFVAVLPAIESKATALQNKLDKAFRAGVDYYSTHGGKLVQVKSAEFIPTIAPASSAIRLVIDGFVASGVDRLFVLSAQDFETVATVAEDYKELQLIGVERDWAQVKATSKFAPRILASVIRAKNIESIDAVITWALNPTGEKPAPNGLIVNDLNNQGAIVTEARDIAYPADYNSAISKLIPLLTSDQGMTK